VNEIAAPPRPATEELRAPAAALYERLLAALPLSGVYLALCVVYLFEAWKRITPWLFTDELELTQLSRSIAATGHAARRGARHSPDSVYTLLTAPLWLIHNVGTAYAGIKYLDVFVMASVAFPTYFLARLVVGRNAALFAAAAAAAIPSLAYSSYIVEETVAYPYAALCFFLIAKALVRRLEGDRAYGWIAAAVVASAAAVGVKGELVVIPLVLVLALLFMAWSSQRGRAWRTTWSVGDWIGAIVLGFGAIFFISGVASHHSLQWLTITRAYKHRIIVEGNWAVGSLAVGMGVIPLIGGLTSLFRARGERRETRLRVFRCVALGAFISFGIYTAMKAAYLSTTFATRVEERNLIYIAPLLLIGTAVLLERRRFNVPALALSSIYAGYLVGYAVYHAVGSPYEMGVRLYSDALGFAIAQQANLRFYWTPVTVRWVLLATLVVGVLVLLAVGRLQTRRGVAVGMTVALGVAILGWNVTGEIAAAASSNEIAREEATTLRQPFSWVDQITQHQPTLYLGQGVSDQTAEWLLEFWNRSITGVSSVDGTLGGPGPAGGPNFTSNGTLFWSSSPTTLGQQYEYAVEDGPCVDLAGTFRADHAYSAGGLAKSWRLIQLTHPNRLNAECTGISPDGWSGPNDSAYFRFGRGKGWLRIVVSRRDAIGPPPPSPVHVLLGKLVINANEQPILGAVTKQVNTTVGGTSTIPIWLRTTTDRFAVHVVIDNKFVPCQVAPSLSSDCRTLGAQVSYRFFAKRP